MHKLVIFLGLVALASAHIPNVCESCQSLVQNFVDASKDRMKMAELKVSLSIMCMGTSHQSDCHKTLDKLDIIAVKLAPYLKNTAAVCSKLQMCSDSPIARLVTMYLKKTRADVTNNVIEKHEICEECKYTTSQFQSFFTQPNTLLATKSFINQFICKSSGKYNEACQFISSFMIPQLVQEIQSILDDHDQVCSDLALCQIKKPSELAAEPKIEMSQIWRRMRSNDEQFSSCFECTLSADAMLAELLKNRQATADDAQKIICEKVNANWTAGCIDFVHMYLSTALYLSYNQVTGREICEEMHSCDKKNLISSIPTTISTCEQRCKNSEQFVAENVMLMQPHFAKYLTQSICSKLPSSLGHLCVQTAHRLSLTSFKQLEMVANTRAICTMVC